MPHTAILVIDVQRGLFDPQPRPFEADAVIERINTVTAQARSVNAPVIFVQHERAEGLLEHGSESWHMPAGLVVQATERALRKTTPDSFLRTGLERLLRDAKIDTLVICGYATQYCIDTTARRAASLGFNVTLVADAHTTHDTEHASAEQIRTHHNATLVNLKSFGVQLQCVKASALALGS